MKPTNRQQEILFFTGTKFAQAELKSDDPKDNASLSKADQLENALWNGMLFELLPELKEKSISQEKMFMWRINNYGAFMSISLGNSPEPVEHFFSVDPYLFLDKIYNN